MHHINEILSMEEIAALTILDSQLVLVPAFVPDAPLTEQGTAQGRVHDWVAGFLRHVRLYPDQRDVLRATLRKVLQQTRHQDDQGRIVHTIPEGEEIHILLGVRQQPSGWLDYGIVRRPFQPNNATNGRYIAVVQRTIGAEVEFHS